jgi:peptidoglycan/xylan/chitin deacetylase (PgdA/CDA1 family)
MVGKITIKRGLKFAAGQAAAALASLRGRAAGQGACIFTYHRIADVGFIDPHVDDWNISPRALEQQIIALQTFADLVPLRDLLPRLALPTPPARPLVCLTFDDGYANICTQALPILKRYGVPATVFVVTSIVGRREPMPFDRWSLDNCGRVPPDVSQPMDWGQLEACVASGLIALGSHSHRHLKASQCTPDRLVEEAARSREALLRRFGEEHACEFSYPYGSRRLGFVPPEYAEAVRHAGYRCAVTTDLGLMTPQDDPFLLPRIEAHAVDGPGVLRAKASGSLAPYSLLDRLRSARRLA